MPLVSALTGHLLPLVSALTSHLLPLVSALTSHPLSLVSALTSHLLPLVSALTSHPLPLVSQVFRRNEIYDQRGVDGIHGTVKLIIKLVQNYFVSNEMHRKGFRFEISLGLVTDYVFHVFEKT